VEKKNQQRTANYNYVYLNYIAWRKFLIKQQKATKSQSHLPQQSSSVYMRSPYGIIITCEDFLTLTPILKSIHSLSLFVYSSDSLESTERLMSGSETVCQLGHQPKKADAANHTTIRGTLKNLGNLSFKVFSECLHQSWVASAGTIANKDFIIGYSLELPPCFWWRTSLNEV